MVLSDPELTQAVSKILLRSERVAYVAERFQLDNDNNQFSTGADRRSGIYPIADQATACCTRYVCWRICSAAPLGNGKSPNSAFLRIPVRSILTQYLNGDRDV